MLGTRFRREDIGLLLLSSGVLSFEITLTRLFAIQQFHHFGFVVISLAVLGFAASGIPLSARSRAISLSSLAVAFSISVATTFAVINYLPFDSYTVTWDQKQVVILFLYFLGAATPFFFAGWGIGFCLTSATEGAHKPYALNLIGSAMGCIFAILGISAVGAVGNVILCMFFGTLAAAFFALNRQRGLVFSILALSTILVAFLRPTELELNLSPYKPLSITQLAPGAVLTIREETLSARVDMLETSSVHIFPGLSLNAKGSPPPQAALFVDGDGPIPATKLSLTDPFGIELSRRMPTTLAYQLREGGEALIIDPGGGLEALVGLVAGAKEITLAQDRPLLFDVLENTQDPYMLDLLQDPRLTLSGRSSRSLLADKVSFDIILFALTDSYRPITSGAFSLSENYLLTTESFTSSLDHLRPDGLLVITRWLGTPPSEAARAWATLLKALNNAGIAPLATHTIAFRGMRTATMIASPRAFSPSDLSQVREFLNANAFDPIHLPDLGVEELNRFNRLPEDVYYKLFGELMDDLEGTVRTYPYNIRPATDQQPFFYHFFRWQQTSQVISELGLRWQPFGGSGYLVILILLGMSTLLALPLSATPLFFLRRRSDFRLPRAKTLLFFIALGAGYLTVEIPLIQKFTLLFDRPSIAFTVVLFSLLSSSGLGSLLSNRFQIRKALGLLVVYLIFLNMTLPDLIQVGLPLNLFSRSALTLAVLLPAGFLMGMPFAIGLRMLERNFSHQIPWAWAVNGAASAVAGVVSAMLSLEFGLYVSLLVGAGAYLLAWLVWFGRTHQEPSQ